MTVGFLHSLLTVVFSHFGLTVVFSYTRLTVVFVCPPEGGLGSSWLKHALKQRPPVVFFTFPTDCCFFSFGLTVVFYILNWLFFFTFNTDDCRFFTFQLSVIIIS
jgi:hypothetical protein